MTELRMIAVSDLKPVDWNPRKHLPDLIEKIKRNIEDIGWLEPCVANKDLTLLGGHQRLKAAIKSGMTEVPCFIVDIPKDKEKLANLSLNKLVGEWDTKKLDLVLEDLDIEDLELAGFDLDDKPQAGMTEDDAVPDVPEEPTTKPGQIFQLGKHRIMCGDSTRAEDVARLMGGEKANMVFTDPPYNVDYGANKHHPSWKIRSIKGDKQTPEEWEMFCKALYVIFKEYCIGDIYMWGAPGPDGMKMRLWLVEAGCHWSATIVWKKQQLVLSPAKYQRMYEPCFYGWLDKSSYRGDRKQTEVWEIDRPLDSKLHPTMKPVELCAKGIQNSSNANDIVMDLFLGSGSTLIACEKTNRICYGMEMDPHYCDVIIKRWEDFTGETAEAIA